MNTLKNIIKLHRNEIINDFELPGDICQKCLLFVDCDDCLINSPEEYIDDILERAHDKDLFDKYKNIFFREHTNEKRLLYFLQSCNYSPEKLIDIINSGVDINLYPFLQYTNNAEYIKILLQNGLDINKIFHGEYCTTFINFLARKCVCEDNSENLKLFQFAIDNGADCSKSNFLQNISGVQYENRQYRKDFVKFLIDRNLIDTTNHIIFENKMLYDTRLGKCILELKNIIP